MQEAVGIVAIKYSIPFQEFKQLSEWLDCYEYRLPADRVLNSELVLHAASENIKAPVDVFKMWLVSDILYTCFSYGSQERMLLWLKKGCL